jgi:Flp pilus assembly protein TadG
MLAIGCAFCFKEKAMIGARSPEKGAEKRRPGAAAVELALLLPLLAFLFVVAVDFARLFYYSLTITNCARNGAMWACDPAGSIQTPYKTVTEAALADAGNISPTPTVTSQTVSDSKGNYAEVTVRWTFKTITNYPGVPSTMDLSRTVRMRMVAAVPNF